MDREGKWDKVIQGYGGPILRGHKIKIQRMPCIVPKAVVSPAHRLPAEVLVAFDEWAWRRIRACKRLHITDPEGTDLRYTNHDAYWDGAREVYRRDHVERHYLAITEIKGGGIFGEKLPLLAKSTGGTQYGGLNRPGIMQ